MPFDRIEKEDIKIIVLLIILCVAFISCFFLLPLLIAAVAFLGYLLIYYWIITVPVLIIFICVYFYRQHKMGKKYHLYRNTVKNILILVFIIIVLPLLLLILGHIIGIWVQY